MFISEAFAQATPGGAGDPNQFLIGTVMPIALMLVVLYFFIIRPQSQARKRHMEMVAALKKNDIVVTSGGFIGKVKSVADDELRIELAPNVDVRILRGAVSEVRSKSDPAPANDAKAG